MTAAGVLWWACIAAEVGALAAALRWSTKSGKNYSKVMHLRDLVRGPDGALVAILAFVLVADLAIKAGQAWLFTDPDHPVREAIARIGWPARAWYHCETALVAGWPLAVAWASGRVFGAKASGFPASSERTKTEGLDAGHKTSGRSSGAPAVIKFAPMSDLLAGLFLGIVIGMAASYPLRPGLTRWLLWAWEAVCVAAAWAGVRRGWPGRGGAVETAAIVLVACETMVCTCGPFLSDPFTRWWIATAFYLVAFAGVGVVLGRARRPGVS